MSCRFCVNWVAPNLDRFGDTDNKDGGLCRAHTAPARVPAHHLCGNFLMLVDAVPSAKTVAGTSAAEQVFQTAREASAGSRGLLNKVDRVVSELASANAENTSLRKQLMTADRDHAAARADLDALRLALQPRQIEAPAKTPRAKRGAV